MRSRIAGANRFSTGNNVYRLTIKAIEQRARDLWIVGAKHKNGLQNAIWYGWRVVAKMRTLRPSHGISMIFPGISQPGRYG